MKKILFFCFVSFSLLGCDGMNNNYQSLMLLYGVQAIEESRIIQDNDIGHYKRYTGASPLICFMGDSRIDVYQIDDYYSGKNIINYGRAGSTTKGIIRRVPTVISWNPDIVIISVGYNNIPRLYLYPDPVGDIIYSCNAIKKANPGVTIYVTNIVPNTENYNTKINRNEIIKAYNDQLETACNANGINYLYFDVMEDGAGNLREDYSIDGVHYNDAGYDALTVFLKSRIPELN